LPIRTTWYALGSSLADAFGVMQIYATPVPRAPSLELLTALSIALVAVIVDALAAGLRQAAWAGLPILAIYAIPAAVLPSSLGVLPFLLPAAGYLLLLATDGSLRIRSWGRAVGRPRRTGGTEQAGGSTAAGGSGHLGRWSDDETGYDDDLRVPLLGSTGRRVGFAAIALAVAVPALVPSLPPHIGRGNGTGTGAGSGNGRIISVGDPVVALNRDLRRGRNVPLFTYRVTAPGGAPAPSDYISTVVLDKFDGKVWKPSPRVVPSQNSVQGAPRLPDPPGLMTDNSRTGPIYGFSINADYASPWLPLAYPPATVHVDGDWRFDASTFDLVAAAPGLTTADERYTETVAYTAITPAKLRNAGPAPADVAARYTQLPSLLPDQLFTQLNRAVKGHKSSKYDMALAIQQYFRTNFRYSLQSAPGAGMQALVNFLHDRTGYCQQFAATMALMARAEGIPARVVVGFLPGKKQADGTFLVRAHDAHSWPELYFAGYGWVRFEPTPSSRTGAAPSWANAATVGAVTAPKPATKPNAKPTKKAPAATQPPLAAQQHHPTNIDAPIALPGTPWWRHPATGIVLGALVIAALGAGLIRAGIRRFRLRRGQPPQVAVERAWQELLDRSRDLGLTFERGRSVRSMAGTIERGMGESWLRPLSRHADDRVRASAASGGSVEAGWSSWSDADADATPQTRAKHALARLRLLVEQSRYAPHGPAAEAAGDAGRLVRVIVAGLTAYLPARVRLRAWLMPRSLADTIAVAARAALRRAAPRRWRAGPAGRQAGTEPS
jgi:transglutaminase-like putative cysteine protease